MAGITRITCARANTSGYCMGSRNQGSGSFRAGIMCPMARYRSGTAAAAATMNFVHITRISRSLRSASWSTVSDGIDFPWRIAGVGDRLLDRRQPDFLRIVEDVRLLRCQVDRDLRPRRRAFRPPSRSGPSRRRRSSLRSGSSRALPSPVRAGRTLPLPRPCGPRPSWSTGLVVLEVQLLRGEVHAGLRDAFELSHDLLHPSRSTMRRSSR